MEQEKSRNFKLGGFVLAGTILLILALYFIGSKRNLFSSTFHISATFYDVNGLMRGNNVRFDGIDVGTVETVEIINDSSVKVVMMIMTKITPFIRKNAIASVSTDGLMGNKIVNINAGVGPSKNIEEGDELQTLRPIDSDVALRTLNTTNTNLVAITGDVKSIAQKINGSNALWKLLSDTTTNENIKQSLLNLKRATANTIIITDDAREVMSKVKGGKGTIGSLLSDTVIGSQLKMVMKNLSSASKKMDSLTAALNNVVNKANKGSGTVNTLLTDTAVSNNLARSLVNLQKGTDNFNQDMEGLKESFLLRSYFKKQEKAKKKKAKQ